MSDKPARVAYEFHKTCEKIKDARLRNGGTKAFISTENITYLIVKHKDWSTIEDDIINYNERDLE